jgi:hypothetical protein
MDFQEITALIVAAFPDAAIDADTKSPQPVLVIPVESVNRISADFYMRMKGCILTTWPALPRLTMVQAWLPWR